MSQLSKKASLKKLRRYDDDLGKLINKCWGAVKYIENLEAEWYDKKFSPRNCMSEMHFGKDMSENDVIDFINACIIVEDDIDKAQHAAYSALETAARLIKIYKDLAFRQTVKLEKVLGNKPTTE